MRRFHQYLSLTPAERSALRQAWLLILAAKLALRLFSLTSICAFIEKNVRSSGQGISGSRLADLVGIAGRRTVSSTCLERSLALAVLMRRAGLPAVLRIGVRSGDEFEAHAWVEQQGANPPAYAPLLRLKL